MKISFCTALCHVLALITPAIRLRAFLPARLIGQAGISTKV